MSIRVKALEPCQRRSRVAPRHSVGSRPCPSLGALAGLRLLGHSRARRARYRRVGIRFDLRKLLSQVVPQLVTLIDFELAQSCQLSFEIGLLFDQVGQHGSVPVEFGLLFYPDLLQLSMPSVRFRACRTQNPVCLGASRRRHMLGLSLARLGEPIRVGLRRSDDRSSLDSRLAEQLVGVAGGELKHPCGCAGALLTRAQRGPLQVRVTVRSSPRRTQRVCRYRVTGTKNDAAFAAMPPEAHPSNPERVRPADGTRPRR